MPDLLFYLLLGHYAGDFALQSDSMAREKAKSWRVLTLHVTIYTATVVCCLLGGLLVNGVAESFLSSFTLIIIAVLFVQHWLQDHIKATYFNGAKQAFYVDQAIHVLLLYAIRLVIY